MCVGTTSPLLLYLEKKNVKLRLLSRQKCAGRKNTDHMTDLGWMLNIDMSGKTDPKTDPGRSLLLDVPGIPMATKLS